MYDTKTKAANHEDHTLVIYGNDGNANREENIDKDSLRKMNGSYNVETIKKKRKIALDEFDAGTKFKLLPDLEKALRIIFLRKMWAIFTLQLAITYSLMCLGYINKIRIVFYAKQVVAFAMQLVLLGFMLILLFFQRFTKCVPVNYISFVLWTCVESLLLIIFHININSNPVDNLFPTGKEGYLDILMATFGMILASSLGMTLYCCMIRTKFNFFLALLMCFTMIVVVAVAFLIKIIFFPGTSANQAFSLVLILPMIYEAIAILALSVYFVLDTMINLNKIRSKYQLEDFVIAALNLYIDPINVFAYVVTCIEY